MQQRHSNGEERLRLGVGAGLTEIRHIWASDRLGHNSRFGVDP
jgi:hypothetical protein